MRLSGAHRGMRSHIVATCIPPGSRVKILSTPGHNSPTHASVDHIAEDLLDVSGHGHRWRRAACVADGRAMEITTPKKGTTKEARTSRGMLQNTSNRARRASSKLGGSEGVIGASNPGAHAETSAFILSFREHTGPGEQYLSTVPADRIRQVQPPQAWHARLGSV